MMVQPLPRCNAGLTQFVRPQYGRTNCHGLRRRSETLLFTDIETAIGTANTMRRQEHSLIPSALLRECSSAIGTTMHAAYLAL